MKILPTNELACRTAVIFLHFLGEQARAANHTRREGRKKQNNARPHTIVHVMPVFIYERGYLIGYLMSSDHEMFLDNKMAVASLFSVDLAIRDALLVFFSQCSEGKTKEMYLDCFQLCLEKV